MPHCKKARRVSLVLTLVPCARLSALETLICSALNSLKKESSLLVKDKTARGGGAVSALAWLHCSLLSPPLLQVSKVRRKVTLGARTALRHG